MIQNIDCGYASPRRFERVSTINVLNKIVKNIKHVPMKIVNFTAENNLCILHGEVFIMHMDVVLTRVVTSVNKFCGAPIAIGTVLLDILNIKVHLKLLVFSMLLMGIFRRVN